MIKTKKMLEVESRIGEPIEVYLKREYEVNRKSTVQIGKKLGISDVGISKWIRNLEIKTRGKLEAKLPKGFVEPTKEELNKWYHIEGKSTVKIGRELGVSDGTIRNWIKEYGIPKRNTNTISEKFLNLLKKDKTALNLSVAALSLNGQGYDLEKTIVEVYEGTFKDEKQLHALLLENENEIYRLAQNGVTNLGKYLGQFTFGDRRIMPLLLGEALESIPEDKVTEPLEERFARILRTNYSPRFNENSKKTMNDLEKKIASSSEKVKGIYQKLYNHYEEVLELEMELNN